jgi:hypothetical protein
LEEEVSLPPVADREAVEHVRRLCRSGKALISRKRERQTERFLTEVWNVRLQRLGEAVAEHIALNRTVFQKTDVNGHILEGLMQANVTLADGLDVYVELELKGTQVVIVAAHSHYTTPLPQYL